MRILAQPIGGISHFVPHHAEVRVLLGRILEIPERLPQATHFHQRRAFERAGEGILTELLHGTVGEREGVVEAALGSKQLEVFGPRRFQPGVRAQGFEIGGFRLVSVSLPQEMAGPN